MKKLFFSLVASLSFVLVACGPSKIEIKEMSVECDVTIEIQQVLSDSISLYVGNMFFLNAKQAVNDNLFPLSASIRDPMSIETLTRTDVIQSGDDFIEYLRKNALGAVSFGIVIGESAANEIGFDETKVVRNLQKVFENMGGGSLILFHEKGGELVSAKKLF